MGPLEPADAAGQIVYFIELVKVPGRFDALIGDCPLDYASPNASAVRDVIGRWMLSMAPPCTAASAAEDPLRGQLRPTHTRVDGHMAGR